MMEGRGSSDEDEDITPRESRRRKMELEGMNERTSASAARGEFKDQHSHTATPERNRKRSASTAVGVEHGRNVISRTAGPSTNTPPANLMPQAARSYLLHSVAESASPMERSGGLLSRLMDGGNQSVLSGMSAADILALANSGDANLSRVTAPSAALSQALSQQPLTNQFLRLLHQQRYQQQPTFSDLTEQQQVNSMLEAVRQDQRANSLLDLLVANSGRSSNSSDALSAASFAYRSNPASALGLWAPAPPPSSTTSPADQLQLLQVLQQLSQAQHRPERALPDTSMLLRRAAASLLNDNASLGHSAVPGSLDSALSALARQITASSTSSSTNNPLLLLHAADARASAAVAPGALVASLPSDRSSNNNHASLVAGIPSPASPGRGAACTAPRVIRLALPTDDQLLSEYQRTVRKQLEFFVSQQDDVDSNARGRKKKISLGQIGIRCVHCASMPLRQRGIGAVYYPAKLSGVYQAAQNMASSHLAQSCQLISNEMKESLKTLRDRRDTALGGKQYWVDACRIVGLYETEEGIWLRDAPPGELDVNLGRSIRDRN